MSNLGVIDADPAEPPSDEEVIRLANQLLSEFNIPTTIEDIGDICAALFVLLYENLFSDRLTGIIRQPVSKEDEIYNCQTVIDVLSSDIVRDSLSHIRGIDVVNGDITAISNLLDIFSYLLDYVANRIDSDFATDNEDGKSWTAAEEASDFTSRQRELQVGGIYSPTHHRETLARLTRMSNDEMKANPDLISRESPEINTNENQSGSRDKHPALRPKAVSSFPKESGSFGLAQDDLHLPPSPIRLDQSGSLLGHKTIDSTELDLLYGKDVRSSAREYPTHRTAFEEKSDLNERCQESTEKDGDGGIRSAATGGAVSSSAATAVFDSRAPATLHGSHPNPNPHPHYVFTHHLYHHYGHRLCRDTPDLEPQGLGPRESRSQYLSATMPAPRQSSQSQEARDGHFRSTVGPIDYRLPSHTTSTVRADRPVDTAASPPSRSKSISYEELRRMVEKTAAMTREALQTSPVGGRVNRELDNSDVTAPARSSIPSDSARMARELNAQGMRRRESPSRPSTKKVAFSSYTEDTSGRHRHPLEELTDNSISAPAVRGEHSASRAWLSSHNYASEDNDTRPRTRNKSPAQGKQPRESAKKPTSRTDAFAQHLARSRQPELGAAHMTLKTQDRAMQRKQEFLRKMYEDDLGDFSEDVKSLMNKDKKASMDKEKELWKSYLESRPAVGAIKKNKAPSKSGSGRKPKLRGKSAPRKVKDNAARPQSPTPAPTTTSIQSEEDLLPFLLNEFPHLHLSDHTWHELCRKGLHQIETITRVYKESKRKKSVAQLQLEEAAQKQEVMSNIMRKELEHTKRVRELKEQKAQQVQVKNKAHDKRVQSARARRYYNEYQVRARGKQLKRRTREEMVFRDLFKDAMRIQKERIKDIRQYATDQRKTQQTRRQNEMESLENFYQDQFAMLAEKLAKERTDTTLRERAQGQMVDRIKQELRRKIESEIRCYQDQMFRDEDDAHFRQIDAERVKRQLHMTRYATHV